MAQASWLMAHGQEGVDPLLGPHAVSHDAILVWPPSPKSRAKSVSVTGRSTVTVQFAYRERHKLHSNVFYEPPVHALIAQCIDQVLVIV